VVLWGGGWFVFKAFLKDFLGLRIQALLSVFCLDFF
jgi:hypothetical protein